MSFVYSFDHPHDRPRDELAARVGGKGANLAVMTTRLGLPVPPGFTITTDACRSFLVGGWPDGLDDAIRQHIGRLEATVGRRFGDPENPLLVSVRSGAPVSMPGMMDTILNLGLNDATTAGLARATGDPEFATGCRDRLAAMYTHIVGCSAVPEDPWEQLRAAIEAVFESWNSPRARSYREREGIPDDLGTAVNVQAMVFGNLGGESGTGVLFTRNPATGEARPYGDVIFDAQGEDVVAGTHPTEDISVLNSRMPEIAAELWGYADTLDRYFADMSDIEFTIERGKLWMLQVRVGKRSPQAALRIAIEMAEDQTFPLSKAEAVARVAGLLADPPRAAGERTGDAPVLTTGLAASPGIAAGRIAITPESAVTMAEEGEVILVRRETSPDDVHGMAAAVGILTSTGGLASHAAVVARGWGIPAVVGASDVSIGDSGVVIGRQTFAIGDQITIDGSSGEVFPGAIAVSAGILPDAAKLLGWAEELGIDIGGDKTDDQVPEEAEMLTVENTLRALVIKGFVMASGLAPSVFATEEETTEVLERLAADGLVEKTGPMFKISDSGKAQGMAIIVADREAWGSENAEAALEGFLPFDLRMKNVVTAWQMREVDGQLVPNDHSDADYDRSVMDDLGSLVADADAWLAAMTGSPLDRYRTRLQAAWQKVEAGDPQYIAFPMVDSYHNVWFELHEDLILLAGRNREDEVAAGRA